MSLLSTILLLSCCSFSQDAPDIDQWVEQNDLESLREYYAKNPEALKSQINLRRQETVMHLAAWMGRPDVVRLLSSLGGDCNIKDRNGNTPLHIAVLRAQYDSVVALVESGANVHAVDHRGFTPLYKAVSSYCRTGDIIDYLLRKGANPNIDPNIAKGYTVLHHILRPCKDRGRSTQKMARILSKMTNQETNLRPAREFDRVELIQKLVDHQADVNARNVDGETPIHLAAESGLYREYRCLEAAGADPASRDNDGSTPACRLIRSFMSQVESQKIDEMTLLRYFRFLSYLQSQGNIDEHCVSMYSPGGWGYFDIPTHMYLALYEDRQKDWRSTKLLIGRLNNAREDMKTRRLIMAHLPKLNIELSVPVFLKFLAHKDSRIEQLSRDQLMRISSLSGSGIPRDSTRDEWAEWFQTNKANLDEVIPVVSSIPAVGFEFVRGYKIQFGQHLTFFELGSHCLTVRHVSADSNAKAAGVEVGDIVLEVNHQKIGGMLVTEFINQISGPSGSEVDLLLQSEDGKKRAVRVKRELKDAFGGL